jgi:hypothetical protein
MDDTSIYFAEGFSCGRAFIGEPKGGYSLIDVRMQRVGTDEYTDFITREFVHGYALVRRGREDVIIDTTGRVVFRPGTNGAHALAILDGGHFLDERTQGDSVSYRVGTLSGHLIGPNCDAVDRAGFMDGLLRIVIDGRLAVMDTTGRIVWKDTERLRGSLRPFNVDYMLRGYFYAYSSPEQEGVPPRGGGWAISNNIPRRISGESFIRDSLQLVIDSNLAEPFAGVYRGYSVYLANTTKDTCRFRASDSRLYLTTEARVGEGVWKPIDYLPWSFCGNSYHTIALEPGAFWRFRMPKFEGVIPVALRLKLEYIDRRGGKGYTILYSNIVVGGINPGQYWNKEMYYPQGVMDPYRD